QLGIGYVARTTLQAVLADDHRPFLTLLQILRYQEYAFGKDIGIHVQDHLISAKLRIVVDLPRAGIQRYSRLRKLTDDLFPEMVSIAARRIGPRFGTAGLRLRPELRPYSGCF